MVFLYGFALICGRFDGVLAQGMITAANLVGPLAGQPLGVLIVEISARFSVDLYYFVSADFPFMQ